MATDPSTWTNHSGCVYLGDSRTKTIAGDLGIPDIPVSVTRVIPGHPGTWIRTIVSIVGMFFEVWSAPGARWASGAGLAPTKCGNLKSCSHSYLGPNRPRSSPGTRGPLRKLPPPTHKKVEGLRPTTYLSRGSVAPLSVILDDSATRILKITTGTLATPGQGQLLGTRVSRTSRYP
jgi:hypothetical protein